MQAGFDIAPYATHRVPEPEPLQCILGLERIVEEFVFVIDARKPRHRDELIAQDLMPERLHRGDLREESVTTDVEAKTLVLHGARNTADHVVAFQNGHRNALLRQEVGGCQATRARTDNDDVVATAQRRGW